MCAESHWFKSGGCLVARLPVPLQADLLLVAPVPCGFYRPAYSGNLSVRVLHMHVVVGNNGSRRPAVKGTWKIHVHSVCVLWMHVVGGNDGSGRPAAEGRRTIHVRADAGTDITRYTYTGGSGRNRVSSLSNQVNGETPQKQLSFLDRLSSGARDSATSVWELVSLSSLTYPITGSAPATNVARKREMKRVKGNQAEEEGEQKKG